MDTLDLVSENEESVFSKINTIGINHSKYMIITGNTDVVVRMSHVQVLTYQNQNLKDTL